MGRKKKSDLPTTEVDKELKEEVYDTLKSELFNKQATDKDAPSPINTFIQKYIQEAVDNPTGKAANLLARTVFKENILELLDSSDSDKINRDKEFLEYRLLKHFYDRQREIILDCNKFKKQMALTSRRTGKTTLDAGLIVYEAITPKSNITYINLTFTNAVNQIFDLVVDYSKCIGFNTEYKSKNEGVIRWANGSQLKIAGNSNNAEADKLRGFKCRLAIIDEIGHQRNIDYLVDEILLPQMVDFKDSTLLLTGTPSRVPHHFSTRIFQEDNSFKKYHFTMLDNPFIPDPRKFIEEEATRKGYNTEDPFIRREYFGEIVADTEAVVFKNFNTYDSVPDLMDFNPIGINIGGDYGYQDYNGIVTVIYNKTQAYVLKEDKFNKSIVSKIIDKVREHYAFAEELAIKYGWHIPIKIYADYNEESITKELMLTYHLPAFNCYKYNKAYAIEKLAELARTNRLLVPKGGKCAEEMEKTLYKRDPLTDAVISEISDDFHPDILMALLYASRRMFFDMGLDVRYKMQEGEQRVDEIASQVENIKTAVKVSEPIDKPEFKDLGVVG